MKRIESLTFIRFLAAVIVVIFHFGKNTKLAQAASPFIVAGPQMVSLFFVLSGFVMMVAHYHKENETISDYYLKRIARILPVYLLALALSVYFFHEREKHLGTAIFLNLTFLQSWFPPYASSLNIPAWSLSVEAFFYLTFPLALFAIKRSNISWVKLAAISIGLYFFTQAILSNLLSLQLKNNEFPPIHDLIYYFPLAHYCSFLLGIAGGLLYVQNSEKFSQKGLVPFILLILTLTANYIALQKPGTISYVAGIPFAFGASFYSLPFLLFILSLAYAKNFLTKIISLPFLVVLGEASYSLYILQAPVHEFYISQFSGYTEKYLTSDGDFFLFLAFLSIISIASFYLIEKPAKKIILRLYSKTKKPLLTSQ